jgi:hypothetical protein
MYDDEEEVNGDVDCLPLLFQTRVCTDMRHYCINNVIQGEYSRYVALTDNAYTTIRCMHAWAV